MPMNSSTVPAVTSRPSFLQTIKEGFSFGVGSSIGHRIVSAASGEPTLRVSAASGEPTLRVGMISQTEKPSPSVDNKTEEYEQCMKKYDNITCKRFLGKDN